ASFENLSRSEFLTAGQQKRARTLPVKKLLDFRRVDKGVLVVQQLDHRFEDFEQLLRRRLRAYFCPVRLRDCGPVHAPKFEKTVMRRESRGEDLEVRYRIVTSFARAGFRPCAHAAKENLRGRAWKKKPF